MKIDPNEISRALRMMFCKEEVFEIRVLNACLNGAYGYTRKEHNESGFFSYDEIDKIPGALEVFNSASGVYFTPNPLVPLIYSKCGGRIEDAKKHGSASDKHVLRRRWLLVDCDAHHVMNGIEVSGISSSEEEHQYAIETAYEIADHLQQQLFPDPIILDSGNGCQLMYAVDLPSDEKSTALVQYVLKYLSRFDNEHVKVDQSVFNPSRIWRLPGTQNCKGDASPDRPHRMARVLQAKPDYEIAATEHLERLAGIAYDGEHTSSSVIFHDAGQSQDIKFNLENWIQRFCPDAKPPVPYNGGRKWILPVCPFNSDHDNYGCAAIFETPDGKPGFECRHDGCKDNHWKELRTLLDQEYRERGACANNNTNVDLSGITGTHVEIAVDEDDCPVIKETRKRGSLPFPEELYNVPGIVGDLIDLTMRCAFIPNKPLAFGGALAMMSTLVARKVVSETGATPNIYIIEIAKSGTGKNKPREINKELLLQLGMQDRFFDRMGSGAGLEDAIFRQNAILWQNDECQDLLHDLGIVSQRERENNSLSGYLLQLYTDANSFIQQRGLAKRDSQVINRPHMTLLGTTTPSEFFTNISDRLLQNGIFTRMNFIFGNDIEEPDLSRMPEPVHIDDNLLAAAKKWSEFMPPGSGNLDIAPKRVQFVSDDVKLAFNNLRMKQWRKQQEFKNDTNDWKETQWSRFVEVAGRYMLLYACSASLDPEKTVITSEAVEWASRFVEWDINNKIYFCEHNFYQSEYQKNCEFVIDMLLKWHEKKKCMMPSGELNRRLGKFKPMEQTDIVNGLIKQNRLVVIKNVGRGGGCKYALPEFLNSENSEQRTDK